MAANRLRLPPLQGSTNGVHRFALQAGSAPQAGAGVTETQAGAPLAAPVQAGRQTVPTVSAAFGAGEISAQPQSPSPTGSLTSPPRPNSSAMTITSMATS